MTTTTYSFDDVNFVVSHPSFGSYTAFGAGLGSIKVTMTTDNTKHDVAADGSVMVSKVMGQNGTLELSIQQVSEFHHWLLRLYNYLYSTGASEWASATAYIRSPFMGDLVFATGVSFKIRAEIPFEADGQQVTWDLLAANVSQANVA